MYKAVIVDDEPFVVEGLKNAIDWSGYNFELALCTTNPKEALAFLEQNPADLLVTDISMPEMDGIELIRRTRQINSLISILVLSAYDNFDYVRSAMRQGAENYLLKPLDPDELAESISRITAHLAERSAISGAYGSAMLTFRSSFIENWVKDSLGEDEFVTRAQMLGINLYLDNYTVLLFYVAPAFPGGKERMSSLFDYLLSQFVGCYISHFYFETPMQLVCIVSSADPARPVSWLLDQMDTARRALNFPFFVSAGQTVDTFDQVSASYRSASKFLFLRCIGIHQITAGDMVLSPAALRTIQTDLSGMDMEKYRLDIETLLQNLPGRRIPILLEVVNFSLTQAAPDVELPSALQLHLKALLSGQPKLFSETSFLEPSRIFPQESEILSSIFSFVRTCCEAVSRRQEAQTASYPCVDACIAAVHEFSDKDISLKTLAAKLNMHPSYLGNVFHQQTGFYFNDYLNEERLKYAATLIETTDMKMKDIVDKVGFSSQTYFNRQFRRRFGTAPNTYRREIKMKQN